MAPTSQMRAVRELEPPALDEGFAAVDEVPFQRAAIDPHGGAGVLVAAPALERPGWREAVAAADPAAPHLLFDWRPDATPDVLEEPLARLRDVVPGPVAAGLCPHGAGPPRCWCRPPLPGLALAFTAAHRLDAVALHGGGERARPPDPRQRAGRAPHPRGGVELLSRHGQARGDHGRRRGARGARLEPQPRHLPRDRADRRGDQGRHRPLLRERRGRDHARAARAADDARALAQGRLPGHRALHPRWAPRRRLLPEARSQGRA